MVPTVRTCGTTRESFTLLKKSRFLIRPTLTTTSLARPESAKTASLPRDAPCPKQDQQFLLTFRAAWIGPTPRASREHILILRTLRAKGTIQVTLSIFFQQPAKHLCATMRDADTLALPVTHAHQPVRSDSRAAHGRFARHDRTVLQFRYGEGRSFTELSRALPHKLPRGRYPWNQQALDNHLQGWKYILPIRREDH